ncbi:hypothetical protein LCGC14_2048230, partial [marine sediment metagenome]
MSSLDPIVREDLARVAAAKLPWELLRGRTVLITGASGFLPRYMVETLLLLNDSLPGSPCKVLALVRNEAKARERFAHHLGRTDLELLVQDVCRPINVGRHDVDFIIHAASQASPKHYSTDPVGTFDANTLGTHNMLSLARERQAASVLFFSSAEVYGRPADDSLPLTEDTCGQVDPMSVRSC